MRETEKMDVYSLGLLFWQLRARVPLFDDWTEEQVKTRVAKGKLTPPLEAMADYPIAMQELMAKMWRFKAKTRPSAAQVVEQLEVILASHRQDIEK